MIHISYINITNFFSRLELLLIGIILVLLVIVILLVIYAVILRVIYNARNRYIVKKQAYWEKFVLEYISGATDSVNLTKFELKPRDWIIFGEFIENYLVDLKGEDYDTIIQFLREIEFNDILIKALDSSDQWDKTFSAYFLGIMKYRPAEQKLMQLVYNKSSIVSITAFEALNKIGSNKNLYSVIKFVLNSVSLSTYRVFEIILSFGDYINPILVKLLQDMNVTDKGKRLIVDVLASRNFVESLPVITKLAYETKDAELIIGCIKAIDTFGTPESIDFLMSQQSSSNWAIRSQAIKALGNISPPSIIPELKMRITIDNNYWVKMYGAEAIMGFGEKGKKELESLLGQNPEDDVANIVKYVLYKTETE